MPAAAVGGRGGAELGAGAGAGGAGAAAGGAVCRDAQATLPRQEGRRSGGATQSAGQKSRE